MARPAAKNAAPPEPDARTLAQAAFAPALGAHLAGVRARLLALAVHPHAPLPQVLLFEGGSEDERRALALWWAALLHCARNGAQGSSASAPPVAPPAQGLGLPGMVAAPPTGEGPTPDVPLADAPAARQEPCLDCRECVQIGAGLYRDLLQYDGRISNRDDAENPGVVRAFNMDNARELKSRMADSPRGGGKRVVILGGIDISREAAANALLKALEDPSPTTVFVLLTPQREQLLPTLVSRSWVLTLPWGGAANIDPALHPWEEALAAFLATGRDWWAMTSGKGSVDQAQAQRVIAYWQKALVRCHAAPGGSGPDGVSGVSTAEPGTEPDTGPLPRLLRRLPEDRRAWLLYHAASLLDEAQHALGFAASPPRVLDSVAARLYVLVRKGQAASGPAAHTGRAPHGS